MPRFLCAQLRICLKRPGFAAIIGLKAIASVDCDLRSESTSLAGLLNQPVARAPPLPV